MRRCGTVRVHEEHRVAEDAAFGDHHGKPALERLGILDVAALDRPFDAARIGERTDRIGGREPGHQAIERSPAAALTSPRLRGEVASAASG